MPRHQLSEIVYFFILVELFEERNEKISEKEKKFFFSFRFLSETN